MAKKAVGLVVAGQTLEADPGDRVAIEFAFTYRGPAWDTTMYAAFYQRTVGMVDEISGTPASQNLTIPASNEPVVFTGSITLVVPARYGEVIGVYAKLDGHQTQEIDNAVKVSGWPTVTVSDFRITGYSKQ